MSWIWMVIVVIKDSEMDIGLWIVSENIKLSEDR